MSADFVEPLNDLVGSRFYAVEFILDYLRLQFDGPQGLEHHEITVEVDPRIRVSDQWFEWGKPGFRDALCDQFGAIVHQARTDIEGEQILIEFDNGALISIPLRIENFVGPEAADYAHSIGQERPVGALWRTDWKDDWQRLYTAKQ
ncbi:MAG TPA: hypothetical protein VHR15_17470 [Ktedonobacterales bacterium]|jgi:hypothetical protein|nr:hypothetical protein [Ktedonobacterales bacterium]